MLRSFAWNDRANASLLLVMQVVAILESGDPLPFTIQAADLDLPELQGEPEEIAAEKCRLAAQQVNQKVEYRHHVLLGRDTLKKGLTVECHGRLGVL